jgi:hypothetical protein
VPYLDDPLTRYGWRQLPVHTSSAARRPARTKLLSCRASETIVDAKPPSLAVGAHTPRP